MLSISNVGSHQAASYYSQDGYYVRNDNTDNTWQGKLKDELKLPDNVTKEHFNALIEERKERAGFDLCFSAPKSISVAICIDEKTREDMIQAHEAAVTATLTKIERREIGARVTKNGETSHIKTGNMLCGKFNHYVSRSSDPQLHTHAVILNQTLYEGKLYAVDNIDLYKNKMLYGQIYRNQLASELLQRGYDVAVTDPDKGFFELKDINEDLLKQFSTRRSQILDQLKEWDIGSTPQNAAQAALTTRQAKEHKDMDLLIKSWKETVDEMGGMPLIKTDTPIIRTEDQKRTCYDQAIESTSRKNFAFTEKMLRKKVLAAGVGCSMSETDYEKLIQGDPNIVHLGKRLDMRTDIHDSPSYYTTKQNLKTEQEIFHEVATTKGKMSGIDEKKAQAFLKSIEDPKAQLLAEQRQAVLGIAQSKDQYFAVQGLAGTGKTFMLNYARQVLEHEGYIVKGACFTGKAAEGLQNDAKIPSITLHSHLNSLEKEAGNRDPTQDIHDKISWNFNNLRKSQQKEVWIVDEASMVDNSVMRNLMDAAKRKDAKVVFVGDDKQLLPVGVGNAYGNMIQTKKINHVTIEEIFRQKEVNLLQSVKEAVKGDIEKSFKLLDENIQELRKPKERLNAIVTEYIGLTKEQQKETIILTASNKDRRTLNNQIREELIRKGALPKGKELNLQEKVEDPIVIKEFSKGDKVIFLKNDNRLNVKNGQTGTVQEINNTVLTINSGDKTVVIDTNTYSKIDHGYAMTTHKAQGITVDRALIHLDSSQAQMNTRNAFYVDISRARHEVKVFTDDKEKIKDQVRNFAQKIDSESFILENYQPNQPKNNLYQKIKAGAEKIFNTKATLDYKKSKENNFTMRQ